MRVSRIAVLAAAGALVLSACGAEDTEDTAPAPAPAPEEEAAEEPADPRDAWPDELVFTLTPSAEAGGLIETAEPLGALLEAELGVPVTPLVPSDYAGVIAALASGQAQIAGGLGPRQMVQA